MRGLFVSFAICLTFIAGAAAYADDTTSRDRSFIKNAGMISAAEANCSTLSINAPSTILLDKTFDRTKDIDELRNVWAEGSSSFYELMETEGHGMACIAVLTLFPDTFDVTINGKTFSGNDYVKAIEKELPEKP